MPFQQGNSYVPYAQAVLLSIFNRVLGCHNCLKLDDSEVAVVFRGVWPDSVELGFKAYQGLVEGGRTVS